MYVAPYHCSVLARTLLAGLSLAPVPVPCGHSFVSSVRTQALGQDLRAFVHKHKQLYIDALDREKLSATSDRRKVVRKVIETDGQTSRKRQESTGMLGKKSLQMEKTYYKQTL